MYSVCVLTNTDCSASEFYLAQVSSFYHFSLTQVPFVLLPPSSSLDKPQENADGSLICSLQDSIAVPVPVAQGSHEMWPYRVLLWDVFISSVFLRAALYEILVSKQCQWP